MTASQETTPVQIANLLRSQDVAPVQRQQQQQSGFPSSRDLGPSQQQQGSHDSAFNQPQDLSIGFAATGEVPNTSVNAATLQQPSFPPEAVRQLGLMGLAHSQQPGPVYAKFNQSQQQRDREFQPQGVNHSSPGDVFSSPNISNEAIRCPSPSSPLSNHVQPMPAVASGSQPQPGMLNSDPRRLTVFDLNTRARGLTQSLAEAERTHQAFAAQIAARGGQVDPMSAQRLTALKTDIMVKKDNLNKVTAMMNSIRAQQGQIQGGGGAGNQASWTLPTASFENNSQPGRPKLGQNPPQQQQQHLNSIQASPSLLKAQASPNHLMPQGAVPTRSVSSPHQQAQPGGQHTGVGGPFANQVAMSGSMGGHSPLAMGGPSGSPGSIQQGQTGMNSFPVPLDKARFEQSFRAYCTRKNLNVNLRQLQIDNRPVELYQLHRNVMLEFGVGKVEQKALWDVIGGRMGFVQFSGTETEPAKSGPGVAQQLAHIYKELLAAFDHYYISSVFEARLKAQAQVPRNPAQMSPQMMQSALTYAHMSVSELHQRGVPEKIITFVEANRANLQRTYADQRSFQSRLRLTNQNDAQGSGDQNGPSAGGPGQQLPFGGPPTQRNSAVSLGHQQNRLDLLEGNNFLDNRQPQQRSPQQGPPMQAMRPTKELIEKSQHFIQSVKRMFNTTTIPSMPAVDIPVERQAEYLSLLNTLHTQCLEIEPKLAMYLVFTGKEEPIKRMAAIICTVAQQKSFGGSRFIVTLDMLQKMHVEMKRTMDGWAQRPFAHQPQHSQLNDAQGSGDQMAHLVENLVDSLNLEDPAAQKNPAAASENQPHLDYTDQQQDALDPLQGNSFPDNQLAQHLQQGLPQPGSLIQPMQPTKEYLEKALEFLRNIEQEVMTTIIPSMAPVHVPAEGRTEHDALLNAVSAQCLELQPKLAAYLLFFGKEDLIRRLVATICIVMQQKSFWETHFITTIDMLQKMSGEIKEAMDGWERLVEHISRQ